MKKKLKNRSHKTFTVNKEKNIGPLITIRNIFPKMFFNVPIPRIENSLPFNI